MTNPSLPTLTVPRTDPVMSVHFVSIEPVPPLGYGLVSDTMGVEATLAFVLLEGGVGRTPLRLVACTGLWLFPAAGACASACFCCWIAAAVAARFACC